ncbi:MAG: HDOD domain-containing protein [Gammaproteobacteria bacterium]|nr:HDOD domain-containing protein [Gammaproteobacteria bacterium]
MISEQEFLDQIYTAIKNNSITLPTLPEVALRIRDAVEQEDTTAREIADLVATDAALAARLLQVANSPLYRGRVTIDSIQMAVTRLGNKLIRNLILSLAMKQIFQATSDTMDTALRTAWDQSVQVAAISRALSKQIPHLLPEQAMLAGLVHNIGILPVLVMAENHPDLVEDGIKLRNMVDKVSPYIGESILKEWGFPENMSKIPLNFQNIEYDGGAIADYVDLVIVSRLQTLPPEHHLAQADWSVIPSFSKIGLEPEIEVINIDGVSEEVEEVCGMLLS